jgi:hypothetical protein
MADEDKEKGGGGGGAGVADAIKLGVDIIKWTCRPSAGATMVEGGFAHCVPTGYTEQDMEGGVDKTAVLIEAAHDDWKTTYSWHVTASWKSNVSLNGQGYYITDATIGVTSDQTSLHLGWEWNTRFPGMGRWVDRSQQLVELPFTLEIKSLETTIVDTLFWIKQYRGSLRGDGHWSMIAL